MFYLLRFENALSRACFIAPALILRAINLECMIKVVLKGIQMTAISRAIQPSLYEEDYYLWLERTVEIIKNRDAKHLDWQHLGEEIDALGNEQKRAVESYLKQLLIHLLLYAYWQAKKTTVKGDGSSRRLTLETS